MSELNFTNDTGYRRLGMEGLEIYDFLRLVFITFIISLIVISIILLIQRKRSTIVNFGFPYRSHNFYRVVISVCPRFKDSFPFS